MIFKTVQIMLMVICSLFKQLSHLFRRLSRRCKKNVACKISYMPAISSTVARKRLVPIDTQKSQEKLILTCFHTYYIFEPAQFDRHRDKREINGIEKIGFIMRNAPIFLVHKIVSHKYITKIQTEI